MKLKKIASLALAGIMAVSMLAGCNNGSGDKGEVVVNPSDTSIAGVVNNEQSATNKVKVTFTYDSNLENYLKQAIAIKGTGSSVTNDVEELVKKLTAETYVTSFWDENTKPSASVDVDGKSQTYLDLIVVDSTQATTEKAAMKVVANQIDEMIADNLVERTANVNPDSKYYVYGYEGSIAMVSVTNANNTVTYYVVGTVTQTATEKEA